MKAILQLAFFILGFSSALTAQKSCSSFLYKQREINKNPSLLNKVNEIVNYSIQNGAGPMTDGIGTTSANVITIPVVVHVLYHTQEEKISDAIIAGQIKTLNECFRRQNADSVNTPAVFKSLAADCEIQFKLATSDPKSRSTSGIVKKYTPVTGWVGSSRVDLQACKLEYSIVSPK